jgi:3',5'-cyclic AMP phosphodiesterase CpdA
MPEFRLTQISDSHLARRYQSLTDNFHRIGEYIDATRPDLVVNSGDLAFDAPTNRDDLEFARTLHDALPVECRYLPGNHDIGDNPTAVGPVPSQPTTDQDLKTYRSIFGEDRWRFEATGWCFIGLDSQVMNTGLASEAEQFDWLASELADVKGKPVALFLHKPLYLNAPDDPELAVSAIRYVPMPARSRLVEMLRRRSAAGRKRPRSPAPGFYLCPYPPHLGALDRLHHPQPDPGSDRHQASRAGGVSLPARQL